MYTPNQKILNNYARVMVRYALGYGKGVKKGETVYLVATEDAKPLFLELRKEIWRAGGNVIANYMPSASDRYQVSRDYYELAQKNQLEHFPAKYMKGIIEDADHYLYVISEGDPHALKGVDPRKIMAKGKAFRPFMDWRTAKENKGDLTWSICLYGTPAMAAEVGISEEAYWKQITDACFLEEADPVKRWREVSKEIEVYRKKLNALTPKIEYLHIQGPDADLKVTLGEKRQWIGGVPKNIPTFELFTSPDWRGTEGWIRFNQPLYRYGNLITGIELVFKGGKVVKATAKENESVLKAMVNTPGADKIGEFSLTDKRHSRITQFMGTTLYDENAGGTEGNTHLALGNCYEDTLAGDPSKFSRKQFEKLGFNYSSVHTDIISTASRTVTAHLKNNTEKVIYRDGSFVL